MQLFPNIAHGEDLYFNPMMYSLKKADFWATTSKTYYKEIFEKLIKKYNTFNERDEIIIQSLILELIYTLGGSIAKSEKNNALINKNVFVIEKAIK